METELSFEQQGKRRVAALKRAILNTKFECAMSIGSETKHGKQHARPIASLSEIETLGAPITIERKIAPSLGYTRAGKITRVDKVQMRKRDKEAPIPTAQSRDNDKPVLTGWLDQFNRVKRKLDELEREEAKAIANGQGDKARRIALLMVNARARLAGLAGEIAERKLMVPVPMVEIVATDRHGKTIRRTVPADSPLAKANPPASKATRERQARVAKANKG
jgi:hypothetical protein